MLEYFKIPSCAVQPNFKIGSSEIQQDLPQKNGLDNMEIYEVSTGGSIVPLPFKCFI